MYVDALTLTLEDPPLIGSVGDHQVSDRRRDRASQLQAHQRKRHKI